ncbi:uncharacterized protein LOC128253882 isoform X2 [Drosophila gunungcola]|uniref:uncharacterized protein LOC128253882 isoform X2 n=1 Tax=Drosophila gunungcola TaxID=103775 RepID=UPI0022DF077F|nr:uncharacterized protein LOC128253882 isoform X2 [Drosophila gunungcola]
MKTLVITLLLAIGVLAKEPRTLNSLFSYLDEGKETLSNLGNTKKCFARYLPELESQGATWSKGYSGCQKSATNERQSLLTDASVAQEKIKEAALRMSSFIDQCLTLTEPLDFFHCFSKMALILNQKLGSIEMEHYLCTNQTERDYVQGTDKVFRSLDQCLQLYTTN